MTTLPTTVASGSGGHLTHHEELHKGHNAGLLLWFFIAGNAAISNGVGRLRPGFACELIDCFMEAGTAPGGASLIANVRQNGAGAGILAGGARPRLLAGSSSGAVFAFSGTTLDSDDYLTADVEQIGSSTPGADVTLHVRLRAI